MSLILLELNEINFEIAQKYLDEGKRLPFIERLIERGFVKTQSEKEYKHLEPWIQWPSVHTGLPYNQHKIFRLGDGAAFEGNQIFEVLERAGKSVGAISPMNAVNRLQAPAYFIPDPWTKTDSDATYLSQSLHRALKQTVNDNSQGKISTSSVVALVLNLISRVRPFGWLKLGLYFFTALGKPWRKALFLDKFLFDYHLALFFKKKPDFSVLFLNAGAHIQHHYFLSSKVLGEEINKSNPSWYVDKKYDPVFEMLVVYDRMIGKLIESNTDFIVATGLSQVPFDRSVFYYRLKNHAKFLKLIGISFKNIEPRMTRDFLVTFECERDAELAALSLGQLVTEDGEPLFGEIDNRGVDLFVVLTLSGEVCTETIVRHRGKSLLIAQHLVFVAIKNGEHDGQGYLFAERKLLNSMESREPHVGEIYQLVSRYFGIYT